MPNSIFNDDFRARDAAKDEFKLMGLGALAWIFIVILGAAGLAVSLYLQPWAISRERENVVQSNAWVQTQVTALVDFQSSYAALDVRVADFKDDPKNAELVKGLRAQQAGLIRQMRQKVAELPPGKVPADIAAFLATH
jgi:hypothetical protein